MYKAVCIENIQACRQCLLDKLLMKDERNVDFNALSRTTLCDCIQKGVDETVERLNDLLYYNPYDIEILIDPTSSYRSNLNAHYVVRYTLEFNDLRSMNYFKLKIENELLNEIAYIKGEECEQ